MFKNTASQKVTLLAIDTAANTPKTGDAANITAYVAKDDGAVTVLTDTSATELDATNAPGLYSFDLSQAETNGDKLLFSAKSSTSGIKIVPQLIYTHPTGGIASPTNITAGTIATVTNGVTLAAGAIVTASFGTCVPPAPSGMSTLTQAQVTGGAYALNHASFAFNAAVNNAIADAVLDEALSGHLTLGSFGYYVGEIHATGDLLYTDWEDGGRLDLILDARAAAATALSTATWTATRAGYLDNLSGGAVMLASSYSAPPSASTISTQVASDLAAAHGAGSWATATGFSTLDAAGVRAAVGLATANLDTQLADLPTVAEFEARTILAASYGTAANQSTIIGYIDTEVAAILAAVDTEVAAIKAKTDQLTFTVANQVDSNALSGGGSGLDAAGVRAAVGLATANLDTQLADIPTVAEFNARTLVAASYFDPAVDIVTTTDTTNITAILADTNELQSDWVNGGRLDLILDARAAASTALSTATWTPTMAGYLDAAISSRMATYTQPTGFLAATFPGTVASTTNITAASGVTISGTTTTLDALQTSQNSAHGAGSWATATGFSTHSAADVVTAMGTGTFLSAIPWNAAWDAEVQSECADALTAYDPPTNAEMEARTLLAAAYGTAANQSTIIGYIDTEVAAILAAVDTEIGAIKAKTDQLTFTVANQVDANALTVAGTADDAVLSAIAALNNLSAAQVNTECDTALTDAGVTTARMAALTDWIDGGRLDLLLDAILDDTGTAGVALSAAICNKVADHVRRRTQANVEASSDGDTLSLGSEYGFIQQAQESNTTDTAGLLTVKKTDGTTTLGTKTIASDAAADPITGIN